MISLNLIAVGVAILAARVFAEIVFIFKTRFVINGVITLGFIGIIAFIVVFAAEHDSHLIKNVVDILVEKERSISDL